MGWKPLHLVSVFMISFAVRTFRFLYCAMLGAEVARAAIGSAGRTWFDPPRSATMATGKTTTTAGAAAWWLLPTRWQERGPSTSWRGNGKETENRRKMRTEVWNDRKPATNIIRQCYASEVCAFCALLRPFKIEHVHCALCVFLLDAI